MHDNEIFDQIFTFHLKINMETMGLFVDINAYFNFNVFSLFSFFYISFFVSSLFVDINYGNIKKQSVFLTFFI